MRVLGSRVRAVEEELQDLRQDWEDDEDDE